MTIASSVRAAGYTLLELLFVVSLFGTATAIAVPNVLAALDESRASAGARYLAMKLHLARMTAVSRTRPVAVRFEPVASGYQFRMYIDGNGNGVRTADVASGIDPPLGEAERLSVQFPGVDFGVLPSLPPVDSSSTAPGTDPIKFGSSNIATFTPYGSSSTGSAYVLGRSGAQFVVRVFGDTGKIRILRFNRRTGQWKPL